MTRKLMASSALVALISAGAIAVAQAQSDPANPPVAQDQATTAAPGTTELAASTQALTPDKPTLASVFIGRSVYSSADPESDNIGDVNDLIVGENGEISHAVIGVGGFLGIGEKDVAVPFDQLKVVEKDGDIRLVYSATKEQLESAPAFDRTAYDPTARAAANTAANDTSGAAPGLVPAPSGDLTAAPAGQVAATPPTGESTSAPADTMAAAPASTPLAPDVGFTSARADQVRASTLLRKQVYGSDNQSIGEISDLVLQKDGKSRVALIDVGGFLGVGEKTVEIPFTDLKFAKSDANAEPQVNVAMSKDQLQQLPAVDTGTTGSTATAEQPAGAPAASPSTDTTAQAPAAAPTDTTAAPGTSPTDQMATGSISETPVSQDIAASKLIGVEAYGSDDADIGEVSDIVFDPNGDIKAVIVDVGGFLGIGEKPVALNFDSLNMRTDESGKLMVSINATKDQLDKAPAYEVSMQ